jgi:hypothetical protein
VEGVADSELNYVAPTPFGIVLVNIGDCKAFLYSKQARTVTDITAGNRGTDDASDPGGRIGEFLA